MKKNKIKIIGGKWKNYKIHLLKNYTKLRPTTSKARKTLFDWLNNNYKLFNYYNCLDCYTGSGALSLEAMSYHAKNATCLELNKKIALQLKKNVKRLKIKNIKVIITNCILWLSRKNNNEPYDLVFIDPPFSNFKLINNTVNLLEKNQWLSKKSFIYIEYLYGNNLKIPSTWKIYRNKTTKHIIYTLYLREKYI